MTFDNSDYPPDQPLHWREYMLRYTGGMVPEVFQIVVKEKGIVTNVISFSTMAKLRILVEVTPLSLLVSSFSLLARNISLCGFLHHLFLW